MHFKELINGVKISVLGIGTWKMGGGLTVDTAHDKECILAIKTAVRLEMTHIDTAELYGNGHAEELVGEAIQEFEREELFIATKVKQENLRYDDLISAAKRSLKRLRTSYIDLYLIHGPNPYIPIEETMKAMDYLVESKLTRFIGVSNFSVEQIEEAQKHAKNKIVANQIEYNLLTRNQGQFTNSMESKIIPYCQKNDVMIIAYRPIAKGELAKPGIKLLDELAEKYGKTQAQIAINWLSSKPNIVTIPKAVKVEHIKENLGAIGWRLSEEDMRRLDYDFPVNDAFYNL
ncbi:MAG: aldo/keto reductase [Candidatus Bathyarchaeota archaeon]|nr:aldo/keto reductase [Candidatus Bathyarchaeota archaeon]